MNNKKLFKILSYIGLGCGAIGTVISGLADEKTQEIMIEEKVREVLSEKEDDEEEP